MLKKLPSFDFVCFVFLIFVLYVILYIFLINFHHPYQHFTQQATSFLNGRLDLPVEKFINREDFVIFDNKYYWHQGPFPSVLLAPFILIFGPTFNQSIMQSLLIPVLIYTLFKLTKLKKHSPEISFYLIATFIFGTPIIGLIILSHSAQYAQIVTITLLSLLLLEFQTRKRYFLLGLLGGAILATRPTAGFILFLVLYDIFKNSSDRFKNALVFLTPVIISIGFLLLFNYLRFGDPFNNGFYTNNLNPILVDLRNLGVFNINYIPANFFYYFLIPPVFVFDSVGRFVFPFITYSAWGLSFVIVAPFFTLMLFKNKRNFKKLKGYLIICCLTMMTLLIYFAPGWVQFGPRYTADFLPIIFLVTILTIDDLSKIEKIIIVLSSLFNLYLISGVYLS